MGERRERGGQRAVVGGERGPTTFATATTSRSGRCCGMGAMVKRYLDLAQVVDLLDRVEPVLHTFDRRVPAAAAAARIRIAGSHNAATPGHERER